MRGRGWRKWKKWVALALMAGMLIGQTDVIPVWAEEGQEDSQKPPVSRELMPEENLVETIVTVSGSNAEASEMSNSIEKNNVPESEFVEIAGENDAAVSEGMEGILTEDQMDIRGEVFITNYATDNMASGKDGDIIWVIDADGKLTVEGTGDLSRTGDVFDQHYLAWTPYIKQITSAKISVKGMTDASRLFYGCENLTSVDVSGFDTSNVMNMECMFSGCSSLANVDVSGFDTSNVISMWGMFYGCSDLTSVDVSGFNTTYVEGIGIASMFYGCSSLESVDVSGFDTGRVTSMASMFSGCSSLVSVDVSGFDTGNVTSMVNMFYGCSRLASVDVSGFDTSNVMSMAAMFSRCSGLVNLDVSNFDTGNVTDMEAMFSECSSLTNLDISDLDTGNVRDMSYMFCNCSGLTSLNLGELDTGNVDNMTFMFTGCSSLAGLDVSPFETGNVKNMACMFSECSSLTSLDISNFDTKNVTSEYGMSGMFFKCNSLKSLNVSGLNTENVVNMSAMFFNCSGLASLDVSSFDTSKVTEIWGMFNGCSSLKSLDISNFDTRNVTNMNTMFSGCSNLTDLDISGFETTNVKDMKQVLDSCTSLQKVKAPKAMGTEVIELPAVFISANGVETQILSQDFCNTTLTRKDIAPTPVKVAPVNFTVVGAIGGRNVTFNTDSQDAVIYYSAKTSNLTTNDTCVKPGETVLFENFYGTIYAKAYANGQWSNVSRLVLKIPVVNKPTITSKDGVVTIKTTTPDSYIYYTTDGSTPSPTNGTMLAKSGGSFTVPANCIVKAIAVRSCFTNSEVVSASVTAKKLGAPSFVVKGVIGGREVTFNSTEARGEIYYSFTTSNITTKDLHVKPGEKVLFQNYYGTVYAKTYVNGQWSNASRLVLKIPVVNRPTITAAGAGKVKISTSTPNCAIYYTTDGSTPSPTNGTRINSSSSIVTVGSGKTVKAIAVRSCFTNSDVATYR